MKTRVNYFPISKHIADQFGDVALCSALAFSSAEPTAPDWVHLLPAGEVFGNDGRGPYRVNDVAELIAASMQIGRLPIDENHATDLAAPKGLPAPAFGWVVAMEARADGIWGRVEWTADGERLVAGKAYRGISPVLTHDKAGNVYSILRASLVNAPNFRALKTLHNEENQQMNLLAKLLAALNLPTTTSEDALVAAVTTLHQAQASQKTDAETALQTALQSQIAPVGTALGLTGTVTPENVLAAIATLQAADSTGDKAIIVGLQSELNTVATNLKSLQDATKHSAATAFVDKAISEGRVGVRNQRDRLITMHQANPVDTEALINGMPKLENSHAQPTPPINVDGTDVSLNADQMAVAKQLGIDPAAFAKTLAAEQANRPAE